MNDYRSPGVYVEELNALSLGIQSSPTAVPVFVGHFDDAKNPDTSPAVQCVRIDSWLSFTQLFKSDASHTFAIDVKNSNNELAFVGAQIGAASVRLFFENGGGACYVLPINEFNAAYVDAIGPAIELCPDITLLCWCEHRNAADDQKVVSALDKLVGSSSPGGMQSRFLLTDGLLNDDAISAPEVVNKQHAAAYFPALLTTYRYVADINNVSVRGIAGIGLDPQPSNIAELRTACDKLRSSMNSKGVDVISAADAAIAKRGAVNWLSRLANIKTQVINGERVVASELTEQTYPDIMSAPALLKIVTEYSDLFERFTAAQILLYKVVALANTPVILRASVAMAGVYARVDRERGVWKAPANVELSGVAGLVAVGVKSSKEVVNSIRIDDAYNDKIVKARVNAVRAFTGRGHMVWGARTMTEATDLNWLYVPVRRLFSTVERDVQDALRAVVFEPNSQPTWVGVRLAISQYLNRLWKQGALAGATPAESFFVHVGLNETMTADDVNQGRLIVRVGLAAVRPAEFIVLQLTQDIVAA